MNIDPRTIKELLQLQMLNKMDAIMGGSLAGSEANKSDFSELFNNILGQATGGKSTLDGSLQQSAGKTSLKPLSMNAAFGFSSPNRVDSLSINSMKASSELDPLIQDASRRNGVQPSLVKAVINAESSFNSRAVSKAGAKGLMQLMDETGQGLGVTNPFDPTQNVHGGTKYLSNLLRKYNGNEGVALAAYNAGSGRMARLGITNDIELKEKLHLLPKETQNYVSKVMKLQREYEA
ncbi:transglycosylase SLT domain-containing protein [Paenibacillus sp. LMG 31456]|uniref:Transglycosylase SLT domain-containing protein n=1 Tax=Paenibacillus foliorum TaxID=2654974 RepID=A0A972K0B0_9BACL|nr:lytic transglycosylase domain-containing protein [Paenibacillus foliorum]NOU95439.1 transglycosylase SLT domain-containing protein [Paenibacillus foliorum]